MLQNRWELPPHTRRKASWLVGFSNVVGTTSAYAEKRSQTGKRQRASRNYLRIRGEKRRGKSKRGMTWELPPHTRRKARRGAVEARCRGTTSAYAEKRHIPRPRGYPRWNYLRIRGEKGSVGR
ncbi:Hypothetical protein CulFRC11_1742 [Corynebacterium ramonii]|uniref:Uncharacterized protein n=1 Tax=Corynebacterium ramonii TaxID=3026968 RepID=A0ABM5RTZ3_9CORY|nr:Hypothetical protein CulFRC11_1742 [Corynebacterium ramonii FRC0011]